MTVNTAAAAAYLVAALLFIRALAGLSKHETAKAGQQLRDPRHGRGAGRHGRARRPRAHQHTRGGPAGHRRAGRRHDRPLSCPGRRDDRHAGADRAVPQLRRPRRGAGRLGRLPRASRTSRTASRRSASRLQGTYGIHHAEVFIGVFIGAVTFTGSIIAFLKLSARIKSAAADAAGQELAEHRCTGRVRRADRLVHRPRRSCSCW